jgi:hypothetical protein
MTSRKKAPTKKQGARKSGARKAVTKKTSAKKTSVKKSSARKAKPKPGKKKPGPKKGRTNVSAVTLNHYADVQQYLIQILTNNISSQTGNNEEADSENNAPHGAFWATMSYKDFTTGDVPNMGMPVLVVGNANDSNIIKALLGQPPFDGSEFPQMPADGPPFLTPAQVQPISDWINNGCPE